MNEIIYGINFRSVAVSFVLLLCWLLVVVGCVGFLLAGCCWLLVILVVGFVGCVELVVLVVG